MGAPYPPNANDSVFECIRSGEMFEYLLEHTNIAQHLDSRGKTLLHFVYNRTVTLRCLELGLDVNATSRDGRTPLTLATYYHFIDVMKTLLEAGAHPNASHVDDYGPLHYAQSPESTLLLLQFGANPNAQNKDGYTALHCHKEPPIQEILIQYGANPWLKDHKNQYPTGPYVEHIRQSHTYQKYLEDHLPNRQDPKETERKNRL